MPSILTKRLLEFPGSDGNHSGRERYSRGQHRGAAMSSSGVLWFEQIGRESVDLVGGKCSGLGEMCKLGVSVPPGFAVTTAAFDEFMEKTGSHARLRELVDSFPEVPSSAQVEELGNKLRMVVEGATLPEWLRQTAGEAYIALSERCGMADVSVAVRSSAVAEDMANASFAGQYDSYLNVRTIAEVLDAIRSCWASMFTTRCISYKLHNGLPIMEGSMSVAVQKMVQARSAGVAFTVNPNTGNASNVVIEGNWGIGESVVQGIVSPDRFTVRKETLEVVDVQICRKERQFVFTADGTEEQAIRPGMQLMPCLTEGESRRLAEIAVKLEEHYGTPLDIEWAVDNDMLFPDNVFLVQCRPVTTMDNVPRTPAEKIAEMMLSRVFPINL